MSRGAHNLVHSRNGRISISLIHQSLDELDEDLLTIGSEEKQELECNHAAQAAPSSPLRPSLEDTTGQSEADTHQSIISTRFSFYLLTNLSPHNLPIFKIGSTAFLRASFANDSVMMEKAKDEAATLPYLSPPRPARGGGAGGGRRRSSLGSVSSSITFDYTPPVHYQVALSIIARVRAFLPGEKERQASSSILSIVGAKRLVLVNPNAFETEPDVVIGLAAAVQRMAGDESKHLGHLHSDEWARAFELDRSFWSVDSNDAHYVDQKTLYEEIGREIVMDAMMHEIDVTCFAYGASGTGKTYSLFGTEEALQDPTFTHDDLGLIPRVFFFILQHIQAGSIFRLSFLEISQENGLRDLLGTSKRGPLRIREHPKVGPFVENLHVITIKTHEKLLEMVQKARQRMKSGDPRAHVLVTAYINKGKANGEMSRNSRIQFVDLAGWEKGHTPSSPRKAYRGSPTRRGGPDALSQNINIQQSLTALGSVLKQLSRKEELGASARSSALTWLTKAGMGDRSHTYLLLCVSPSDGAYQDTLHTLKFGEARLVGGRDENGTPLAPSEVNNPDSAPSTPIRDDDVADWGFIQGGYNGLIRRLGGGDREGARKVLKEIVADPQQKLAKLQTAMEGKRGAVMKSVSIQTALAGDDVIPRSALPSSDEMYSLKSQTLELEMELQAVKVDRDVAISEARIAQEELLRVRHQEMDSLTQKAEELKKQLADAKSDQRATERLLKETETEKEYLKQLLDETKLAYEEECKALEAELQVAKDKVSLLNKRCASPPFVEELEQLQTRLAVAEKEKEKVEKRLAAAKARIAEVEQEATNTARSKMELRKELSLLKSRLSEQSQTVADLKAVADERELTYSQKEELQGLREKNRQLSDLVRSQEKMMERQGHAVVSEGNQKATITRLQSENDELAELVRSQQRIIDNHRQESYHRTTQVEELERLKDEQRHLSDTVRSKEQLLRQQRGEASELAETLYRRVMALEQVAVLDGLQLRGGLRREAGALAKELRDWMGCVGGEGRSSCTIRRDSSDLGSSPFADAKLAADFSTPSRLPPEGSTTNRQAARSQQQHVGQDIDSTYQKMFDVLRVENEELKARILESEREAATVMEKSLIEILLGIREDHERVRQTVHQLCDGKEKAKEFADHLQHQLENVHDYRSVLRQELAALWMTMNNSEVLEAAKSSTLMKAHDKLKKAHWRAARLERENSTLKADVEELEIAARRLDNDTEEEIDLYRGRRHPSLTRRRVASEPSQKSGHNRSTPDFTSGIDLEQVVVAECETALKALLASKQEEAADRYRYPFYHDMNRKKRSRQHSCPAIVSTSAAHAQTCCVANCQRHDEDYDDHRHQQQQQQQQQEERQRRRNYQQSLSASSTPRESTEQKSWGSTLRRSSISSSPSTTTPHKRASLTNQNQTTPTTPSDQRQQRSSIESISERSKPSLAVDVDQHKTPNRSGRIRHESPRFRRSSWR